MRIPKVLLFLLWWAVGTLPLVAQVTPCTISPLEVGVGDCTSDSTFLLELDFKVQNPPSNEFEVFGNGVNLGTYNLNQLPLTIENFPAGAGIGSFVRVCLKGSSPNAPPCCNVKQFFGPNCAQGGPCEIYDINAVAGDCRPGGRYSVKLDFKVKNPAGLSFEVWAGNNTSLGTFLLSDLPVVLSLPVGTSPTETLRICLKDKPDCCATVTVAVPPCPPPPCVIRNLRVKTGACTSDSTYKITLNFVTPAAIPLDSFDVYADGGQYLGRYSTASLPLTLEFPWNGKNVDAVTVCLKSSNCCRRLEFNAPNCIAKPCGIEDIKVDVGECLSPQKYRIKVSVTFSPLIAIPFEVGIWSGNGDFLGAYSMGDFPLGLVFPASGEDIDRIKVCLLTPDGTEFCCKIAEFKAPNCDVPPCPITDLKVEVAGPCNPDSTYPIIINFKYTGSTPGAFGVWSGDGKFLGIFSLNALPVKIAKFPASGKPVDRVRVCLIQPNAPSVTTCCLEAEFKAPDCQHTPCGIGNIKIEVGPCNPDGTYRLVLNFVTAASQGQFALWAANGQFLGVYPFSALPLTIPNFPGSGKDVDAIRICVLGPAGTIANTCCITHEFKAPNCQSGCAIKDLEVKVGDCNPDGTFKLLLNFKVQNGGSAAKFTLWVNGTVFGTYGLGQLPLTIPNFPGGNGGKAEIRVCLISPTPIGPGANDTCCAALTFITPNCQGQGCKITDLTVKVGDCNPDGTYKVQINFKAVSPAPAFFSVWANGQFIGTYPLSALPLTISNFPASGKPKDAVKVCLVSPNTPQQGLCCESLEFNAPDCSANDCIEDLTVKVGPCNPDGTYRLQLNFKVKSLLTILYKFELWANGKLLGTYSTGDLPLTIPNFPASGNPRDLIKVCVLKPGSTEPWCCEELEFIAPKCPFLGCKIVDLKAVPGPCNNDGTYELKLNFNVSGSFPLPTFFGVWANGVLIGTYPLSALPLTISNFPASGKPKDAVKVCLVSSPNTPQQGLCCESLEFNAPDCSANDCIEDLTVKVGPCNPDGTYRLQLNFKVKSLLTILYKFELWANGKLLGTYSTGDLPLTIPNFPASGNPRDLIKVCVLKPGSTEPWCCEELEFIAPKCPFLGCKIVDLKAVPGPCNNDGTYELKLNFNVSGSFPLPTFFGVWANGVLIGTYPLSALPLTISNFPASGKPRDLIKVCVLKLGSTEPWCCEELEFIAPKCPFLGCKIVDLKAVPGPCNPDGTYELKLNFNVGGLLPLPTFFGVWANGVLIGTYPLSALPLTIPNFPASGNKQDQLRVCIVTPNAAQPLCCVETVIDAPDCNKKACKIWDVQVQATPCLCEQFFAVLTFHHQNGSATGFDVVGANGDVYGSYPYSQQQPIILGPFDGDGKTPYVFIVRDKQDPNCNDGVKLGFIDCPDLAPPAPPTAAAVSLSLSPNPAAQWVTVMARSQNGTALGQAVVEVRKPDGRLMRSEVVPNGNLFTLNVAELPAGLYRVSVQTAEGRYESVFVKQ